MDSHETVGFTSKLDLDMCSVCSSMEDVKNTGMYSGAQSKKSLVRVAD